MCLRGSLGCGSDFIADRQHGQSVKVGRYIRESRRRSWRGRWSSRGQQLDKDDADVLRLAQFPEI